MNTIATNIRFPQDEYEELKLLAFSEKKSVAAVIREAIVAYKKKKFQVKSKISLSEKFHKLAVTMDIPVANLVREGRKFE